MYPMMNNKVVVSQADCYGNLARHAAVYLLDVSESETRDI